MHDSFPFILFYLVALLEQDESHIIFRFNSFEKFSTIFPKIQKLTEKRHSQFSITLYPFFFVSFFTVEKPYKRHFDYTLEAFRLRVKGTFSFEKSLFFRGKEQWLQELFRHGEQSFWNSGCGSIFSNTLVCRPSPLFSFLPVSFARI